MIRCPVAAIVLGLLAACEKEPGSEGGLCLENGGCSRGLVCLSDLCVAEPGQRDRRGPSVGDGEDGEGEGEGEGSRQRCTTGADCAAGEGCALLDDGSFCAAADGSGLRVEFGALHGVPRQGGRSASGLVLRNGGLGAKPWAIGRSTSGFTVMGGDLR